MPLHQYLVASWVVLRVIYRYAEKNVCAIVPKEPSIGVELDMESIEKYRVK